MIWTIGHSNRTWEDFCLLLEENRIELLADVRSYPRSRRNPHFDGETMRAALGNAGVGYRHFPELGGFRRQGLSPSPNTAWEKIGFRNYADHLASREFASGAAALLSESARLRTAVMCAEASPYRCHRRLISDYLSAVEGIEVRHVLAAGRVEPHRLHPQARIAGGSLVYPASQNELF